MTEKSVPISFVLFASGEETIPCPPSFSGETLKTFLLACVAIPGLAEVLMQSGDYVWGKIHNDVRRLTARRLEAEEVEFVALHTYGSSAIGAINSGIALDYRAEQHRTIDDTVSFRANATRCRVGDISDSLSIRFHLVDVSRPLVSLGLEQEIGDKLSPRQMQGQRDVGDDEGDSKAFFEHVKSLMRADPSGVTLGEVRDADRASAVLSIVDTAGPEFGTVQALFLTGCFPRLATKEVDIDPTTYCDRVQDALGQAVNHPFIGDIGSADKIRPAIACCKEQSADGKDRDAAPGGHLSASGRVFASCAGLNRTIDD